MKSIERQIQTSVELTPVEVADVIWSMGHDEQVVMLNELAKLAGHLCCFQLQRITDDENLTLEARTLMAQIGNYSERNP